MSETATLEARANELLRELAGPEAEFREHQLEAVSDIVRDRKRVLCVQRTGWGKSAVYFLATALLRRSGAGPGCEHVGPGPDGTSVRATDQVVDQLAEQVQGGRRRNGGERGFQ